MKILIIGTEDISTDIATTELAILFGRTNHGLINDVNFVPTDDGYYHTTVLDLVPGDIVTISKYFDLVKMLDQPKENYSHYKTFITTVRLMHDLEKKGINVEYRNNENSKHAVWWREYLQTNKSFCFYPMLAIVDNTDFTELCPKSHVPMSKVGDIIDWHTEEHYVAVREKMVKGELIPKYCQDCYDREEEGQESTRQFETYEWANRLGFTEPQEFADAKHPMYYEIRPGNKCNIMCRTCDDQHSHLIEKEWKTIGIPLNPYKYTKSPFDKVDFTDIKRLYLAGGEPTIMPEVFEFLRNCIKLDKTDFELEIGTNGMKFSNTLLGLLDHFPNVNFAFSFDGFDKVGDYIRWGSDFNTVVKNAHLMMERGHKVSLQTVFSIYNGTRMHEIFEFFDREFPKCGSLVQVASGQEDIFQPTNHPLPELVVESMRRCQETKIYYMNGRSVKSQVDLLIDLYSDPNYNCNIEQLRKFYEFNDKLDRSRKSQLIDYIPELANARDLYFK